MSVTADLGLGVLFVLAFGNGANDVGKSIVALMTDPDTATFRPRYSPLVWGGIFSGLGSVAGGCGGLDPARNSAQDSSLDNACNRRCDHCTGGLLARCFESTMGLSHLEDPPSPSCWSVCCIRRSLLS